MSVKWKPVARLPVVITVEYLHVKLLLLKCSHISSDQQKEPQESHDENPQQAKSSCVFNVPSSVWSESTRSNTVKFPVHCILNVCAMDPRFPVLNTHTHTDSSAREVVALLGKQSSFSCASQSELIWDQQRLFRCSASSTSTICSGRFKTQFVWPKSE